MTLMFGAVLLCSVALQQLLSPVGDAVVSVADARPATFTGTIVNQPADGSFVLQAGRSSYVIADRQIALTYTGRPVRVNGILHETTGILEIKSIALADIHNSRLDPTPARP